MKIHLINTYTFLEWSLAHIKYSKDCGCYSLTISHQKGGWEKNFAFSFNKNWKIFHVHRLEDSIFKMYYPKWSTDSSQSLSILYIVVYIHYNFHSLWMLVPYEICDYFLLFCGLYFHLPVVSFATQNILILTFNLTIFLLFIAFCVMTKKLLPNQGNKHLTLCFLLRAL